MHPGEKRSLNDSDVTAKLECPDVKRRKLQEHDDVPADVVAKILSTITEPKKMVGPDVSCASRAQ